MSRPPGHRTYHLFICHRYRDHHLHTTMCERLNMIKKFSWRDESVPLHIRLQRLAPSGLRRSITSRIKRSDALLIFAHSSGQWIDHELTKAKDYDIPIIAITDPVRIDAPNVTVRTKKIREAAVAEFCMNETTEIVKAVRKFASKERPQSAALQKKTPVAKIVTKQVPNGPLPKDVIAPHFRVGKSETQPMRLGVITRVKSYLRRLPH